MQGVDFYELSRAVQDRFTGSVRGEGQPRPLLAIRARVAREVLIWSAIGLGGVVLMVVFFGLGIGDLGSRFAIHTLPLIVVYVLLAAAIAIAVLQVVSHLRAKFSLPYRPGTYFFPSGVIDAQDHRLRIFPLSRGVVPVIGDRSLKFTFPDGETFEFQLASSGHAEEVKKTLEEAQVALDRAHASGDKKGLGVLDPLVDIGVANPFAPKTRLEKNTPLWARQVLVVGGALGIVLAPGIWWLRNVISDASMLAQANKQRDAESFRTYLARGGRKKEVREVLLPRAELSEAARAGTVEAIEKYAATHAGSNIQGEIASALRQAMLDELEGTKKIGTVSALHDFARRHPNNLVDTELRQAVHAVYQAAFARYKKESGIRDMTVLAFGERLLAAAEKNGPKVEIRFRRKPTRSAELADKQVKKSPFFVGTASLPSQYFDEDNARRREITTAKTIVSRFAAAFPEDMLSFEVGAPVTDSEGQLPPSKIPTIFIEHSVEMSGAYLSAKPRGVFVGLGMIFDVTFRIPDEGKPQRFRVSIWRSPDPSVARGETDAFEAAVYEAMAQGGFSQFAHKYLATFFVKGEPKSSE